MEFNGRNFTRLDIMIKRPDSVFAESFIAFVQVKAVKDTNEETDEILDNVTEALKNFCGMLFISANEVQTQDKVDLLFSLFKDVILVDAQIDYQLEWLQNELTFYFNNTFPAWKFDIEIHPLYI